MNLKNTINYKMLRDQEKKVVDIKNEDLSEVYKFISAWVYEQIGFIYDDRNSFQLESRVKEYMNRYDITSSRDLLSKLKTLRSIDEQELINLLVNNETYFFREPRFFEDLEKKIVPQLLGKKAKLSIWSLACSSGAEIYSMAIVLEELKLRGCAIEYKIHGSDISTDILEKARTGLFSRLEVERGLSQAQINQYFDIKDDNYVVKDKVKKNVRFSQVNLAEKLSSIYKYDLVLCRNALYYLDGQTKANAVGQIFKCLKDDGLFTLSGTENLIGYEKIFKKCDIYGTYQKVKRELKNE